MMTTMTTMLRFRSDTETNRIADICPIADYERMYKNEHMMWIYRMKSRGLSCCKFSFGSTKKG